MWWLLGVLGLGGLIAVVAQRRKRVATPLAAATQPAAVPPAAAAPVAAAPTSAARSAPAADLPARIDAFWQWWLSARGPLASAIDAGELDSWTAVLSERVSSIEPGLAWELGPGVKSQHHLCVSSEGDAALRVTAERWVSRAPAADEVWEYYPARQASGRDAKLTLTIAGVDLAYDDFRLRLDVDETRRRMQVDVFHPRFGELDAGRRSMAAFLFLDDSLGEDGVERWISGVGQSLEVSADHAPPEALHDAVRRLAEKGPDSFTVLEGTRDGRPLFAVVNFGIKRIDHLLMDLHMQVTIPYPTEREDGLYSEAVGQDVERLEEELLDRLGNEALFIAHETGLGKRVIHLHTAVSGSAPARVAEWERANPLWEIELVTREDPSWEILQAF